MLIDKNFPDSPDKIDTLKYLKERDQIPHLDKKELIIIFDKFKNSTGKAPGFDLLTYNIWYNLFIRHEEFFINLLDLIVQYNYFPNVLKRAKIIFIPKPGKNPTAVDSYRPISLLPTVGKIIERIFVNRLMPFLYDNSILSNRQYGFKENISTEHALHSITESIKTNRLTKHVAMTSIDIKSAFDSVNWTILFETFNKLKIPNFFINFISHYLYKRSISFSDNIVTLSKNVSMGCPQGSVVAPILWNIFFNSNRFRII